MESKKRTVCNINSFHKKFSECKDCNRTGGLKRYYESTEKISIQQNLYYDKIRDKILLQKQNNGCIQIKDLVRSYVQLQNRLKALEEKFKINDSENN